MREPPSHSWITTSTVLQRLKSFEDHDAWAGFAERFRRPVASYARRRGLSDADADDVAQDTLAAFAEAYRDGAYAREKGRLSRWLFGIARNKVESARERNARRLDAGAAASAFSSQLAADAPLEAEWRDEWERNLLEHCISSARGEFRGATWRAFEMLVLESRSVEDVVGETGLTRNAVYIAKHRVLGRVQALLLDCDEFV